MTFGTFGHAKVRPRSPARRKVAFLRFCEKRDRTSGGTCRPPPSWQRSNFRTKKRRAPRPAFFSYNHLNFSIASGRFALREAERKPELPITNISTPAAFSFTRFSSLILPSVSIGISG